MSFVRGNVPQLNLDSSSVIGAGHHRKDGGYCSGVLVILRQVGSPRATAVIQLFCCWLKGCCYWLKGSCYWLKGSCCWLKGRWLAGWSWTEGRWREVSVAVIISVEADIPDQWSPSTDGVGDGAGQIELLSAEDKSVRASNRPDSSVFSREDALFARAVDRQGSCRQPETERG